MFSSPTHGETGPQSGETTPSQSEHQARLSTELRGIVAAQSDPPEVTERITSNKDVLRNETTHNEPLVAWYEQALKRFPELKDVIIAPIEPGKFGGTSRSRFADKNQTHHDMIQIDTSEGADEALVREMADFQEAQRRVGELLGMDPSEITPKKLQSFIMLHELGHTLDMARNAKTAKEYEGKKGRESCSNGLTTCAGG